jgi:hypothetical protein
MPSSAPCTADHGGVLIPSPVFQTVQYERADEQLVQFIAGALPNMFPVVRSLKQIRSRQRYQCHVVRRAHHLVRH